MKYTSQYLLSVILLATLVACGFTTSSEPDVTQERTVGPAVVRQDTPPQTDEPSDNGVAQTPEPAEPTETTSAFDGLYIARVWLIITDASDDLATVQMWFFLSNNSPDPSPQLRLPMFANAVDVFVDSSDYVVATEDAQQVVIRRDPLPANSNDQLLIVDYQLPMDGLTDLTYQIDYPTADFAVYLPLALRPQLEAPALTYDGVRLLRGLGDFMLFVADDPILAADALTFDIVPTTTTRYADDIDFVDFTVAIDNGTADAIVPNALPITLLSVRNSDDGQTLIEERNLDWGGVPLVVSQMPVYQDGFVEVQAVYNGITFWARLDSLEALSNNEIATVTLYETTNDPSVITLDSVWYVVDAVTGEGLADYLVWYFFTNTGDRIYIGSGEENLLQLPLPSNIQGLNFQDDLGPAVAANLIDGVPYVIDNRLIFPQQRQNLPFEFFLPYDGTATLSYNLGFATDNVVVYTSEYRQLAFAGDGFTETGIEELPGLGTYQSYRKADLAADAPIEFTISDTADTPQVDPSTVSTSPTISEPSDDFLTENRWFIFGIGILLVMMGGMYFVYDLQKERIRARVAMANAPTSKPNADRQNELIQQIAALDDAYEQDKLSERDYQSQRQALRDQLRELMARKGDNT